LGYTKEKIAALKDSGVLHNDPRIDRTRADGEQV
jgi:hypothetical protein